MIYTRALPCVMIALSLGASLVYLAASDWRRALYWTAAAVITVSVTF